MLHKLYGWVVALLQWCFLAKRPRRVVNMEHYVNTPGRTDVATIAFNNVRVVEKQIEMMRKYMRGAYNYMVADNSTNPSAAKAIEALCRRHGVIYIRLPKNRLGWIGGSYSHAASLNYVYRKVMRERGARYVGFIDHDLFPIAEIDIAERMGTAPIYGRVVERERFWYLWSGLCFFRLEWIEGKAVDFLPITIDGVYLDSGGGNWAPIYSHVGRDEFRNCETEQLRIHNGGDDYHADFIHIMGSRWLHLINGSNWANEKPRNLNALAKRLKGEKYPVVWGNKRSKDDEIDRIVQRYELRTKN